MKPEHPLDPITLSAVRVTAIHKAYLEGGSTALSSDEVLELCDVWMATSPDRVADAARKAIKAIAIGEAPDRRDDKEGR